MDLNIESTTAEEFDNQPLKKAKCSESSVLGDPLPSPTISTSSMISECSESIGSESDNQINDEQLSSPPSPTKSMLSPVSELMNEKTVSTADDEQIFSADDYKQPDEPEKLSSPPSPTKSTLSPVSELMNEKTVSADDDEQIFSADDYMQPDEPKHMINNLTYDYLPQDYTLTELDNCAHCVIQYSKEDDIFMKIDDVADVGANDCAPP